MYTENKKSIMFQNEVTDSENDSDEENENNFHLRKRRRRNICSTSESETELIEDEAKDTYCNIKRTSNNFIPKIHQFCSRNSGITKKMRRSSKIIDYFELFISQELVEYISDKTNYYWTQKSNNNMDTPPKNGSRRTVLLLRFVITDDT